MSKHDKTSMSSTLLAGSDEASDVVYDSCNDEGQRVQATGHCINCNVNMCVSCIKSHKTLPAVKNHVVKDKSTLSHSHQARTNASRPAEDKDPMTDQCPKHPDELIEFYCSSHRVLGCSDCVSLDHQSCKDISYINDVNDGVENSDELTKIEADLHMLIARLTSTQGRTKWIKKTMNESYSQTAADISNLKKKIINMLDQFETEILQTAWVMNKYKVDDFDSTFIACEHAIRKTDQLIAHIEKNKSMNRNNQLFISMKNAQSRITDLADEADQLCNKSAYGHLSFEPDEQLDNLLSTLTGLGKLIMLSQPKDVKAEYQHRFEVKCESDYKDCGVNGIIVLPDGRVALSDFPNMSVKLIDITKHTINENVKFDTKPLDLTCIPGNMIGLTLHKERYIQVLSVSPALSKSHTIAVSNLYLGIEYIPDKLILVCREPTSAVHVCNMSGVVLQKIETDYGGNKLFTKASRIAISPDHGVMYVSDVLEHSVVCLTIDGKLIRKYADICLKGPVGIAVGDDGYVFVCSEYSNTVHCLSPSGKLVKVILDKMDRIITPFCIAYRNGHLYISNSHDESANLNKVQVYRIGDLSGSN